MTAIQKRICTICSLLCPLDGTADSESVNACPVRFQWLESHKQFVPSCSIDLQLIRDRMQVALRSASKPLIWIEGADVQTVRTAVLLAQHWSAAIHVVKTLGSQHVTSTTCNDGWFGTTLADAGLHAKLVIAIGQSWKTNLPRLQERFFGSREDLAWWRILPNDCDAAEVPSEATQRTRNLFWPRHEWYSRFSQLVQQIEQSQSQHCDSLAQAVLGSDNTTILWETSEFSAHEDEFIVFQLYQLARIRSRSARCSLLPLDRDSGATTASSTLLWLTGCSETAIPSDNGSWQSPERYQFFKTEDWNREFDFIVQLGTTARHSEQSHLRAVLKVLQSGDSESTQECDSLSIGTAGVDHPALLMRGDHGLCSFAPCDILGKSHCLDIITGDDVLQMIQSVLHRSARGET